MAMEGKVCVVTGSTQGYERNHDCQTVNDSRMTTMS